MELTQIAEATGNIKTLFDLARRARELAKKEANAELRGMPLDLQEKAQDVREGGTGDGLLYLTFR